MQEQSANPNEGSFEVHIDEKLREIEAEQFITPKDQLGYAEEFIIVKCGKPDENLLLNYSLSNSLEDIKMAIFKRTGLDIKLEKAKWYINPYLSINIKHLMDKHQVIFSMTTFYKKTLKVISINMHVGDYWFYTSYVEMNGKCHSWDYYETLIKIRRAIKEMEDRFRSNEEEDDD